MSWKELLFVDGLSPEQRETFFKLKHQTINSSAQGRPA